MALVVNFQTWSLFASLAWVLVLLGSQSLPRPAAVTQLPGKVTSRLGVVVGATAAALTTAGTLAGLPWWQGAAAVVALLAVVGWVVRSALRVFGGINGDVLGAVIEVGLGTLLVVLTVGIAS